MSDRWIDAHSVNCIECGVLFDEREGIGLEEGTLCDKCASPDYCFNSCPKQDKSECEDCPLGEMGK